MSKEKDVKKKGKLYRCDPDKNIYCAKTNCYRKYPDCCRHTTNKRFRMNIFKRIKEKIFEILGIESVSVNYYENLKEEIETEDKYKIEIWRNRYTTSMVLEYSFE